MSSIDRKTVLPQAAHARILNRNCRFANLDRNNKARAVIKQKLRQYASEQDLRNHKIKSSVVMNVRVRLKKIRIKEF